MATIYHIVWDHDGMLTITEWLCIDQMFGHIVPTVVECNVYCAVEQALLGCSFSLNCQRVLARKDYPGVNTNVQWQVCYNCMRCWSDGGLVLFQYKLIILIAIVIILMARWRILPVVIIIASSHEFTELGMSMQGICTCGKVLQTVGTDEA